MVSIQIGENRFKLIGIGHSSDLDRIKLNPSKSYNSSVLSMLIEISHVMGSLFFFSIVCLHFSRSASTPYQRFASLHIFLSFRSTKRLREQKMCMKTLRNAQFLPTCNIFIAIFHCYLI